MDSARKSFEARPCEDLTDAVSVVRWERSKEASKKLWQHPPRTVFRSGVEAVGAVRVKLHEHLRETSPPVPGIMGRENPERCA